MNEYGKLCTECYDELYKYPPKDELELYLRYIANAQKPILEPMCGAGRFLIPILERGHQIYGFDHSSAMVQECQDKILRKDLSAHIQQASLDDFSYDFQFDVIFITSGSFGLITDPHKARKCLDRVSAHLADNGVFLVEIETPLVAHTELNTVQKTEIEKSKSEKLLVQRVASYDSKKALYQAEVLFQRISDGGVSESEKMEFRVKHYVPAKFESLLRTAHFKHITAVQCDDSQSSSHTASSTIIYECRK